MKKSKTKVSKKLKKKQKKTKSKYFYGLGRRKTSVASLRLYEGKGDSTINKKLVTESYKNKRELSNLYEPLDVTETKDKFYFSCYTKGGGKYGQLDAIKLALARAIMKYDEIYKKVLKSKKLITVDSRIIERKKPGFRKARKKQQYSKR